MLQRTRSNVEVAKKATTWAHVMDLQAFESYTRMRTHSLPKKNKSVWWSPAEVLLSEACRKELLDEIVEEKVGQ
eukprot:4682871-Amphidinium_carterae.1